MGTTIHTVPVQAILPLRHRILRAGLPIETVHCAGDNDTSTLHFAVFDGNTVIACATLLQRDLDEQHAYQLRCMAVTEERQRTGIGGALLRHINRHVVANSVTDLLWCNARLHAASFYTRHGWQIISDPFNIPDVGPHVRMIRRLASPSADDSCTA